MAPQPEPELISLVCSACEGTVAVSSNAFIGLTASLVSDEHEAVGSTPKQSTEKINGNDIEKSNGNGNEADAPASGTEQNQPDSSTLSLALPEDLSLFSKPGLVDDGSALRHVREIKAQKRPAEADVVMDGEGDGTAQMTDSLSSRRRQLDGDKMRRVKMKSLRCKECKAEVALGSESKYPRYFLIADKIKAIVVATQAAVDMEIRYDQDIDEIFGRPKSPTVNGISKHRLDPALRSSGDGQRRSLGGSARSSRAIARYDAGPEDTPTQKKTTEEADAMEVEPGPTEPRTIQDDINEIKNDIRSMKRDIQHLKRQADHSMRPGGYVDYEDLDIITNSISSVASRLGEVDSLRLDVQLMQRRMKRYDRTRRRGSAREIDSHHQDAPTHSLYNDADDAGYGDRDPLWTEPARNKRRRIHHDTASAGMSDGASDDDDYRPINHNHDPARFSFKRALTPTSSALSRRHQSAGRYMRAGSSDGPDPNSELADLLAREAIRLKPDGKVDLRSLRFKENKETLLAQIKEAGGSW